MENLPNKIVDKDFIQACDRFGEYFIKNVEKYKYTPFQQIYQQGPTCGLTALGMYIGMTSINQINTLLEDAKDFNYTKQGEMFSAKNMQALTQKMVDVKVELFSGYLACEEIVDFLLNGGILLVPYDAYANHEPCIKNGHKAHWALISGVIVSSNELTYVLARQGKSKLLGIWPLSLLAASNMQLNEISPDKSDAEKYVIPEGGIIGEDGLCGKAILIHHNTCLDC